MTIEGSSDVSHHRGQQRHRGLPRRHLLHADHRGQRLEHAEHGGGQPGGRHRAERSHRIGPAAHGRDEALAVHGRDRRLRRGGARDNQQAYRRSWSSPTAPRPVPIPISITWPVETENELVPFAYAGGAAIAVIGLVLLWSRSADDAVRGRAGRRRRGVRPTASTRPTDRRWRGDGPEPTQAQALAYRRPMMMLRRADERGDQRHDDRWSESRTATRRRTIPRSASSQWRARRHRGPRTRRRRHRAGRATTSRAHLGRRRHASSDPTGPDGSDKSWRLGDGLRYPEDVRRAPRTARTRR